MAGVLLYTRLIRPGAPDDAIRAGLKADETTLAEKGGRMIYATARMSLSSERLEEALEILTSVVRSSRCELGCISANVYQDVEARNDIMIEQVWKTEKDLLGHLRSADYRSVLLVAEMALAPPEIRFDTVALTTGVETIEKARTGQVLDR